MSSRTHASKNGLESAVGRDNSHHGVSYFECDLPVAYFDSVCSNAAVENLTTMRSLTNFQGIIGAMYSQKASESDTLNYTLDGLVSETEASHPKGSVTANVKEPSSSPPADSDPAISRAVKLVSFLYFDCHRVPALFSYACQK